MPGDSGHPDPACHDLSEAASEYPVNRLVATAAAVQLDENRRWDAYGRVAPVRAAHHCPDALMPVRILTWAGERGNRLAIED